MTTPEERNAWAAELRDAINSGALETATRAELTEYAVQLCDPENRVAINDDGTYHQICELVRLHSLRIMMEAFEERSKVQHRSVLVFAALAIAATVLAAVAPYFIAPTPILGATPPASYQGQPAEPG